MLAGVPSIDAKKSCTSRFIEWEKSEEEQDGYVFEEIAECLLLSGRAVESRPYFAHAYAILGQDLWLLAQEKQRLERLKQLSEE